MSIALLWRRAALVLAILLAGCVSQRERVYNVNTYSPDASTYLFSGASASRAVPTYVIGNPFGASEEVLANVVAAALQSGFPGRDVRFAVRPEDGLRDDVAMIVAFDPPGGTSPKDVCRAPGRVGFAPSGNAVITLMTFCFGSRALASAEGRLDRRAGIGDTDFVLLIRDMARRMLEAKG